MNFINKLVSILSIMISAVMIFVAGLYLLISVSAYGIIVALITLLSYFRNATRFFPPFLM